MTVKLKVKHLVSIVVVILLLAIGVTQWLIPTIRISLAEKSATDFMEENDNIFELLEDESLPNYKRMELIEENIITYGFDNTYDITVGPGMTQGPSIPLNGERIDYLTWYLETDSDKDQFYYRAVSQLAFAYAKQGVRDRAEQLLSDTMDNMEASSDDYWNLYKTHVEILSSSEPKQAIQASNEAIEKQHLVTDFTELKATILTNQTNYQQALDTINQLDGKDISNHLARQRRNLEEWQQGEERFKVEGRMATSDGDPISFAKVYLRLPENTNHSIMPNQEIHYTLTDSDGNFTIAGVPKGEYQIYIGIDIHQIDGYKWAVETDDLLKVDADVVEDITFQPLITINSPTNYQEINEEEIIFDWEPVKGVAYYRLGFGIDYENGGSSSPMETRITESDVKLPVQRIYSHGSGVMYDQNDEEELEVIPESLLAFANPDGDFYWYVEAFDDEGELITGSNGFRLTEQSMGNVPYFQLKERELTVADKELLAGHLETALNHYKQVLEEDPDNLHALRMIERIIIYRSGDHTTMEEAREEALPYTKRLAQLTTDEGVPSAWFDLAMVAFEQGAWDDYFNYYQEGTQSQDGKVSAYHKSHYAIALMKNGYLDEAEKQFKQIMDADGSHRFMPPWTLLRLYQSDDFDQAQQLAAEYPRMGFHDNTNWSQTIERVKQQVTESEANKQMFQEGLELYMSGKENQFTRWLEEEADGRIKVYFAKLYDL